MLGLSLPISSPAVPSPLVVTGAKLSHPLWLSWTSGWQPPNVQPVVREAPVSCRLPRSQMSTAYLHVESSGTFATVKFRELPFVALKSSFPVLKTKPLSGPSKVQIWIADPVRTKILKNALCHSGHWAQCTMRPHVPYTGCGLPGIPTHSVSLHLACFKPSFGDHLDQCKGCRQRSISRAEMASSLPNYLSKWPLSKFQYICHYRCRLFGSLIRGTTLTHRLQKLRNLDICLKNKDLAASFLPPGTDFKNKSNKLLINGSAIWVAVTEVRSKGRRGEDQVGKVFYAVLTYKRSGWGKQARPLHLAD